MHRANLGMSRCLTAWTSATYKVVGQGRNHLYNAVKQFNKRTTAELRLHSLRSSSCAHPESRVPKLLTAMRCRRQATQGSSLNEVPGA